MAHFTFAFITDPQIGMQSPNGLLADDSDKARLDNAVDYINDRDIDFVLFGGDQVNRGESEEERDIFMASASRLSAPWHGVSGNHDQNDVYLTHDGAPNRFAFSHKDCFFAGFNATTLRGDLGEDAQKKEWDFLNDTMGSIPESTRQRFVVMHWPLFTQHPDEDECYWNMPNRHELISCFKENRIDCVLSGHWHQDIDIVWQGVRLITSMSTSRPLQYTEETAFKLVTVFDDGFSVRRVNAESPSDSL
jgi:3',5'-cyclic AMP phosphodiesterase CpdA